MSKKKPADQVWTDGTGDEFWAFAVRASQPDRSAAYVCASELGIYLTAAQCREVAAHFAALADYHEETMSQSAPTLPPERDGVVLVPADGHEAITTTKGQEFARLTFTTKQDLWYGPNLAARPGDWVIQTTAGDRLTPGTWKVDDE